MLEKELEDVLKVIKGAAKRMAQLYVIVAEERPFDDADKDIKSMKTFDTELRLNVDYQECTIYEGIRGIDFGLSCDLNTGECHILRFSWRELSKIETYRDCLIESLQRIEHKIFTDPFVYIDLEHHSCGKQCIIDRMQPKIDAYKLEHGL